MERYEPEKIEAKWQEVWERERAYAVPNRTHRRPTSARPTCSRCPVPVGRAHMGHVLNYTLGDVVAHLRRRSACVLRPMGYDAFGLPAENAAIREGRHLRTVTEENIAAIRTQAKRMGWSIDWEREVSTHEPEYYK